MKIKLMRALGIALAVGMFTGPVDSSAAEADALTKQNAEELEASTESMAEIDDLEEGAEAWESDVEEAPVDDVAKMEEENIQEEGHSGDSAAEAESEGIEGAAESDDYTENEAGIVTPDEDNDVSSNSSLDTGEDAANLEEGYQEYEYYYEPITGIMVKGPWILPDGRNVFYDTETGEMVKGDYEINGKKYHFDEADGHMSGELEDVRFWLTIDNNKYLYENWVRQGWKPDVPDYQGEEVYDSETDAWYWLDGLNQGKMAVNMDVYQETQADDAGNIGKWVRYGENGQRVRGWTEDGRYYFDPVYGTRAQGTVVIDGEEYEFDSETGERISKAGFENFGIVCNAAADTPYVYRAATCDDSSITTEGTAMFAYSTFQSDEAHPEKEGYLWKQVVITLTFGDVNAHVYGCRVNTLFGLDYYSFSNAAINEPSSESTIERESTVLFQGEECPITARHEVLRSEWGDDCVYHMDICIEYHMPIDYDGMAVALYHAGNVETGEYELDLLDADSLIFRMK